MLTIGAPASVLPDIDPIDDVVWADHEPDIGAVWFIDHLVGWAVPGIESGAVRDPNAVFDPFALIGAAAAATSRVTIGVAVTDPLRRSPAALAQSVMTICWLGGRPMILGLGSGAHHNVVPFGLAHTARVAYMDEACSEIRALCGRDRSSNASYPLGIAQIAATCLYVAAHGPRMIDVAARHADGWLPSGLPPKPFAARLSLLRERAEVHGRDPDAIRPALFAWAVLGETRKQSLAMLDRPLVRSVALYAAEGAYRRYGVPHPIGGPYMPGDLSAAEALSLIKQIPLDVARDTIISGSIADICERLAQYEEAGCEHLVLYDIGRFLDPDGVLRSRTCLTEIGRGRGGWPASASVET